MRRVLVPLLLWAMGLAGCCLIAAALVGALIHSNNLPLYRSGAGSPPGIASAPVVAKKKYPAATAKALAESMQKIAQVLDHEGMNVAREIETVANAPSPMSSKQQIYEMIGRLDRLRNQVRAVESIIWRDVLPAYPDIAGELQDIVQKDAPLPGLEAASKLYFDGLTTIVVLYDKLDATARDQVFQLLAPTREAFAAAASNFQSWIHEAKLRIDEKQNALN